MSDADEEKIPEDLRMMVQTYGAMVGETPPLADTQKCQNVFERMKKASAKHTSSVTTDTYPTLKTENHDKCDAKIITNFLEILNFYETFHDNYIDKVMDNSITSEEIEELIKLEMWFTESFEPIPTRYDQYISWVDREKFKNAHGMSSYCPKPVQKLLKTHRILTKYPSAWSENRQKYLNVLCANHTPIKLMVPGARAEIKRTVTHQRVRVPNRGIGGKVRGLKVNLATAKTGKTPTSVKTVKKPVIASKKVSRWKLVPHQVTEPKELKESEKEVPKVKKLIVREKITQRPPKRRR